MVSNAFKGSHMGPSYHGVVTLVNPLHYSTGYVTLVDVVIVVGEEFPLAIVVNARGRPTHNDVSLSSSLQVGLVGQGKRIWAVAYGCDDGATSPGWSVFPLFADWFLGSNPSLNLSCQVLYDCYVDYPIQCV